MGKPWLRTAEQEEYLQGQVKELLKARFDDTVKAFRLQLYETWEDRWPEVKVLFPQRTDADPQLTEKQVDELSNAMILRKQQLYNRVRWLVGTKPIRTKNPKTLLARYLRKVQSSKDKKVMRKRTILVIYNDLYYKKKIQPLVNAALERESKTLTQPEHASLQLKHYQRIRAECWASESPEVREEVLKIYDAEHTNDEEEENEEDEADEDEDEKSLLVRQQECIEIIGSIINSFLQDASEATGFSFTLMGGGLDKEGNIKICMSSVGKTTAGKTFMATHKDWDGGVSKPLKEFLCLRHPLEERLHRASLWAERSQNPAAPASSAPLGAAPTDAQPTIPNSNVSPTGTGITQPQPTIPNSDVSPTGITQPQPTIPNSDVLPTGITQPAQKSSPAQVPTVPSPNITASSLIPQTTLNPSIIPDPTAPNPQAQASSLIPQTTPNSSFAPNQASLIIPPTVPNSSFAPNQASLIIPPTVPNSSFAPNQASLIFPPTVPNSSFAPNQASLIFPPTIPNSSFAPNQASFIIPQTIPNSAEFTPYITDTFSPMNSNSDANGYTNPQQSLTALMSESLYNWPNMDQFNQQGLGDQDLFDFSGLQSLSRMNNFNSNSNFFLPDVNFTPAGLAHGNNPNSNTLPDVNFTPAGLTNSNNPNSNTPLDASFTPTGLANGMNLINPNSNTFASANINTLCQSHVPVADTPADADIPNVPDLNLKVGSSAKISKKRRSDDADLVLPDGSHRIRKKTCRPDENFTVSTKKSKKESKKK